VAVVELELGPSRRARWQSKIAVRGPVKHRQEHPATRGEREAYRLIHWGYTRSFRVFSIDRETDAVNHETPLDWLLAKEALKCATD